MNALTSLRLLQLADSAIPIGATAHSFGLETLVDEGTVTVATLGDYLRETLRETGKLETVYCFAAHRAYGNLETWLSLNARLDALKTARESRLASQTLGRRFLQLARDLAPTLTIEEAMRRAKQETIGTHHCTAFGWVMAGLGVDEHSAALAFLNQSVTSIVSACQRLMPLGQTAASQLLWELKPEIVGIAGHAQYFEDVSYLTSFTPLLDIASMRHPTLMTRLFIS
jgi:urease accessory protein